MAKEYLDKDGLLYFWQKIKSAFITGIAYNSTTRKITSTKNGSSTDVVTLAAVATSGSYNDLSNTPTIPSGVEKTTTTPLMDGTASIGSEVKFAAGDHVHPTDTSRLAASEKGAANGVCPLNASSKIDSTYLPSYVDDVIEAYARSGQTALSSTWLATGSASGTVITPETGKIYVLMADSGDYAANTQFRWGGSAYVKLADGGVSSITNAEIDTIVAS